MNSPRIARESTVGGTAGNTMVRTNWQRETRMGIVSVRTHHPYRARGSCSQHTRFHSVLTETLECDPRTNSCSFIVYNGVLVKDIPMVQSRTDTRVQEQHTHTRTHTVHILTCASRYTKTNKRNTHAHRPQHTHT